MGKTRKKKGGPSDLGGNTRLVGKPHTPFADRPALGNSGLRHVREKAASEEETGMEHTKRRPHFTVVALHLEGSLEVLDSLGKAARRECPGDRSGK